MFRVFTIAFCLCLFVASHARAQAPALTVDLAQNHVDITTGFNGASLIMFGVKEEPGKIVIVVHGPKSDVVVRRKEQVMGMWLNKASVRFKDVPLYYDYALGGPADEILPADELAALGVGFGAMKLEVEASGHDPQTMAKFRKAFIRNKQNAGLFPTEPKQIEFLSPNFFKTRIDIPSNVPTGVYNVETFLIKDGAVLDRRETVINIAQVGFSAGVYKFAHVYPFIYGLVCVFIAGLAGWLSNAVRRKT
jgi:uncharacterized protein (TIGR02186 family)